MDQPHFYATNSDGSILVVDNYGPQTMWGNSLCIEATAEPCVPIAPYGLLETRQSEAVSLSREDATRLRDFLNSWLGE